MNDEHMNDESLNFAKWRHDYLEEHRQLEKTLISKINDIDLWKELGYSFNIRSFDGEENVTMKTKSKVIDLIHNQIQIIETDYEELLELWNKKLRLIDQLKTEQIFVQDSKDLEHSVKVLKIILSKDMNLNSCSLDGQQLWMENKLSELSEKLREFEQSTFNHERDGYFDQIFIQTKLNLRHMKKEFHVLSKLSNERKILIKLFKSCRIAECEGNDIYFWLNNMLKDFTPESSNFPSEMDFDQKVSKINRLQLTVYDIDNWDTKSTKILSVIDGLVEELKNSEFYVNVEWSKVKK
ncbi:hypothetical protein SNEBB_004483, partial [Seison nebaliae]